MTRKIVLPKRESCNVGEWRFFVKGGIRDGFAIIREPRIGLHGRAPGEEQNAARERIREARTPLVENIKTLDQANTLLRTMAAKLGITMKGDEPE